jgi:hypothetical protein
MNARTRLTNFPSATGPILEWRTDSGRKTAHLLGGAFNESGQLLAMCNHIYPGDTRSPDGNDRFCPLCVDVALDCRIAMPEDAPDLTGRPGSIVLAAALITILAAAIIWVISPIF